MEKITKTLANTSKLILIANKFLQNSIDNISILVG